MYRVVLREKWNGTWIVVFLDGKNKLFTLPFRNEGAASYYAAKFVDELLRNRHEFEWDVQDRHGKSVTRNLIKEAQRRKVRGK